MLAEKYAYPEQENPWRRQENEIHELPKRNGKRAPKKHSYKLFRRRLLVSVILVLAVYSIAVARSAVLVSSASQLLKLQRQETQLITKNSELKIEVEKLKEPERITNFAEKKLGMKVARSNIYVKAK